VLQCVAGCCSVVQCVAVCCSVLQCVAVCGSHVHMWIRHVTYMGHVTDIKPHTWQGMFLNLNKIKKKSKKNQKKFGSQDSLHVSGRTSASCHTCKCIVSNVWKSHVSYMNESCLIYECVMSLIWMRHVRVMSHIWMSHITHTNESCHNN